MSSRRSFFQKAIGATGALSLSTIATQALAEDISDALLSLNKLSPTMAATDEELWARMAQAYTVNANIMNLNNGGVSPQPKVVQDAVDRYYHLSNEAPSYYMAHFRCRTRTAAQKTGRSGRSRCGNHCHQSQHHRSPWHRNMGH